MNYSRGKVFGAIFGVAALCGLAACGNGDADAGGGSGDDPRQVYLNLSYSGNNWQDAAQNLATAVATSPDYADNYDLRTQISGTEVQSQISDIQSMIAGGADLIVSYPISPTALVPVVEQGCEEGVTFVFYDSTVHAPCAYNVAFITGARHDDPERAFFGAQTAEALAEMLDGEGRILMNRGVPGTSTDTVHYETAMSVFEEYPDIEIVSEYHGDWDASVSQQETSRALASHPDIDGVWSQDGEVGVIRALEDAGMEVPVTGEAGNYFLEKLSEGWPGVAAGSPPAQGGIAMKVGLEILENGPEGVPHDIEVPLPWVTTETAKQCEGVVVEDGCNFFPDVDDTFVTTIFQDDLLPEATVEAARTAEPFESVEPLPNLEEFEQPESRRVYTRGECDEGYVEGSVMEGQVPAGLSGCVPE